jgi:hypothetical protein
MIQNITDRERQLAVERDFAVKAMERMQAERDALRELMNCYNLGGWTDSMALMQERDALNADALRYRWLQHKTRGVYGVTSDQEFVLPHVQRVAGQDLMRGSVAQHLDKAIDAAMKEGTA